MLTMAGAMMTYMHPACTCAMANTLPWVGLTDPRLSGIQSI